MTPPPSPLPSQHTLAPYRSAAHTCSKGHGGLWSWSPNKVGAFRGRPVQGSDLSGPRRGPKSRQRTGQGKQEGGSHESPGLVPARVRGGTGHCPLAWPKEGVYFSWQSKEIPAWGGPDSFCFLSAHSKATFLPPLVPPRLHTSSPPSVRASAPPNHSCQTPATCFTGCTC